MRKSIQKQLGLLIENPSLKVRTPRPAYTRKIKHKQDFTLI